MTVLHEKDSTVSQEGALRALALQHRLHIGAPAPRPAWAGVSERNPLESLVLTLRAAFRRAANFDRLRSPSPRRPRGSLTTGVHGNAGRRAPSRNSGDARNI